MKIKGVKKKISKLSLNKNNNEPNKGITLISLVITIIILIILAGVTISILYSSRNNRRSTLCKR